MTNNTLKQLNWRTAVKSYDSTKKLTKQQVDLFSEVARMAPTSYGLQPIKLYIVSDDQTKEKLQKAGYGQTQFTQASHVFVLAARETIVESDITDYMERIGKQRSTKIDDLSGFKQMLLHSISGKSKEDLHSWAAKQAYLVLGMLLAVAAQNSIDTTPMEGFSPGEFDEILGTKAEGFKSVVVLTAGFRDEDNKDVEMPKVRKVMSEFVSNIS